MRQWLAILLLLTASLTARAVLIPLTQTPMGSGSWIGLAGVSNGIPTRSTVYTNFTSSATAAQINTGIQNCPAAQVVFLAAGTYSSLGGIIIGKSGVTLRGAGVGQTKLQQPNTTAAAIYAKGNWDFNSWTPGYTADHVFITGGLSQGSTSLTVAATNQANTSQTIAVGSIIAIDQQNTTNSTADAGFGADLATYTSLANPNVGNDRYYMQYAIVTSVSGNTIGISPGLLMPDWQIGKAPQLWWLRDSGSSAASTPISGFGVENLEIDTTDNSSIGVGFENCLNCWMYNVKAVGSRYSFVVDYSLKCTVAHCWADGAATTDDYPINIKHSGEILVENNIVANKPNGIVVWTVQGCVFDYNFMTNATAKFGLGFMDAMGYYHGGNPVMNLWEGNITPSFSFDAQWGSSGFSTLLRNHITGLDTPNFHFLPTNNLTNGVGPDVANIQGIYIAAMGRFHSIVGNVIGTTNVNEFYQVDNGYPGDWSYRTRVYAFTMTNISSAAAGFDLQVTNTMTLGGNWTTATNSTFKGVYWPASLSDHTISNSLVYTTTPTWFGNIASLPLFDGPTTNAPTLAQSAEYRYYNSNLDPPAGGSSAASISSVSLVSFSSNSITLSVTANPNSADTLVYAVAGTTSAYGTSSAGIDIGSGSSPVAQTVTVSGLTPNTLYHYSGGATNGIGGVVGSDATLTTLPVYPVTYR